MALFLYPHALTAVLSSRSQDVVRRNMSLLPAWTFLLGLMALLGYMAIAAGLNITEPNTAVPALFVDMFPSWFLGVAFAAIAIGALVPAAVMSIAAANLFTRNVWKEFVRPDCSDAEEAQVAKIVSLVVKVGALAFVLLAAHPVRDRPAAARRRLDAADAARGDDRALHALVPSLGPARGLGRGHGARHLDGRRRRTSLPVWELPILSVTAYTALAALAVNLVVAAVLTLVLGAARSRRRAATRRAPRSTTSSRRRTSRRRPRPPGWADPVGAPPSGWPAS